MSSQTPITIPFGPTRSELARALGCNPMTLTRRDELEELPRLGRNVRYTNESVERLAAAMNRTIIWVSPEHDTLVDPVTGLPTKSE